MKISSFLICIVALSCSDIGNRMYGTEYEDNYESTFNPFNVHRDNEDAPCVVCRSQRPTTIMIPARTSCYNGIFLYDLASN